MKTASFQTRALEAKRSSIDRAVRRIRLELTDCYPEDRFELERALRQLRPLLAQITLALERERQGQYGLCEDCGQPIDHARLCALPWATRCLSCENGRDRRMYAHGKMLSGSARGVDHG